MLENEICLYLYNKYSKDIAKNKKNYNNNLTI